MPIAHFVEEKGQAADCQPLTSLVAGLIHIIKTDYDRLLSFAVLLEPHVFYGAEFKGELEQIYEDISLSTEDESDALTFFRALEAEHDKHDSTQGWFETLGAIAECAISTLLEEKYEGVPEVIHYREHKIQLLPPEVYFVTSKPIDAIAWMDTNCCGEFVEIKKTFETLNDRRIPAKIRQMNELKAKVETFGGRRSFVGFGTLAIIEEPYIHLLSLTGFPIEERDTAGLNVDTITAHTVNEWLEDRVAA